MSSDMVPCTEGSDAVCITKFGEGACCYAIEVTEVPSSPTTIQTQAIASMKAIGFPTTDGEKLNACISKTERDKMEADSEGKIKEMQDLTGLKFKHYCDAASRLVASVATAALIIASY